MDGIIKRGYGLTSEDSKLPQFIYPLSDSSNDTFMTVIKLPKIDYDEVVVTIDQKYIEISASWQAEDRIAALFDEDYMGSQIYTTKVCIPDGLNIALANAFYDNHVVTVHVPYVV